MGTVFDEEGYRVVIRTADHNPPHVHVFKAGHEIKIAIGDETSPPAVLKQWDAPEKYALRAVRLIGDRQDQLLEYWRKIHG